MNGPGVAPSGFLPKGILPTPEQELVLTAALSRGEAALDAYGRWRASLQLDQPFDREVLRLLPLLHENLRALGVSDALMGRLKGVYRLAWVQTHRRFGQIRPAVEALLGEGIRTMALKGAPLALAYYGNLAARPMDDVDLAVRGVDLGRALRVLEREGFVPLRPVDEDTVRFSHAMSLAGPDEASVDLHWHILADCRGDSDEIFWSTSEPLDFVGLPLEMPDPTRLLIHNLIHGLCWNAEPPVRWLPDSLRVLEHRSTAVDWDALTRFALEHRMSNRLGLGLRYLKGRFGAPVPERTIEALDAHPRGWLQRLEARTLLRNGHEVGRSPLGPLLLILVAFERRVKSATLEKPRAFIDYLRFTWRLKRRRDLIPFVLRGLFHRHVQRPLKARFARKSTPGPEPSAMGIFVRYFRTQRFDLLANAGATALVSMSALPGLWLLRLAVDKAIGRADLALLFEIGLGLVVLRLGAMGAALLLRRQVVRIVKRAILALREDLLEGIYRSSRESLSRAEIDRRHARIIQETERVDVSCNAILSNLLPAVFTSVTLLAVLLPYSPVLVGIAVLMVPVLGWTARHANRAVSRDLKRFQAAFEAFSKGISFALRQTDLTRAQGYEREEIEHQKGHLRELSEAGRRMSWSFAVQGQLQSAATGAASVLLLVLGGMQVARGSLAPGELLAFYVGAGLFYGSVTAIGRGTADVLAAGASLELLAPLLESDSQPSYHGSGIIAFEGGFALREVCVDYEGRPVLRGVNLVVPPGERVAVVGANGSGKTTLLNVLLALVRPEAGLVLADGRPYVEIDPSVLRRQIGVVMQQPGLFFGSIRDNIAYGRPHASTEAVVKAARVAGADAFIQALPQGYETQIGDLGMALSGGERQRIAIARALLGQPRALILDEPTNHLDFAAVHGLLEELRALPEAPTIILASHDVRVLEMVDRTYEMRDGSLRQVATLAPKALRAAAGL